MLSKESIKNFVSMEVINMLSGIFDKFQKKVIDEYERENANVLDDIEREYESKIKEAEKKVESEYNIKLDELKVIKVKNENEISVLKRKVSSLENALENTRKNYQIVSTAKEKLRGEKELLKEQYDKLGIDLVRTQGRVSELQNELNNKDNKLENILNGFDVELIELNKSTVEQLLLGEFGKTNVNDAQLGSFAGDIYTVIKRCIKVDQGMIKAWLKFKGIIPLFTSEDLQLVIKKIEAIK